MSYRGFKGTSHFWLVLSNQQSVINVMDTCNVLWDVQSVQISLDYERVQES